MVKTQLGLFSLDETIITPIRTIITKDIMGMLGIADNVYLSHDPKDNLIKKVDKLHSIVTANGTKDEVLYVGCEEDGLDDYELSLIPQNPDTLPIYKDKEVGSYINPIYLEQKITFSINYTNKSKNKVMTIINKLRLLTSRDGMYRKHDIQYSYVLPTFVIRLLQHINELKNLRNDDKLDLDLYVNNSFDNRVDFMNTEDGDINKTALSIREMQKDVLGYIVDDLHTMKPVSDEDTTTWGVSFDYVITYQKPIALLTVYPLMVFNTTIRKEFRTFINTESDSRNAIRTLGSSSLYNLTKQEDYFGIRQTSNYIAIPANDTYVLPNCPKYIDRMFSVMAKVSLDLPRELFNINDIPKIQFKDSIRNFLLTTEYPFVGTMFRSMFYFSLYKDNKLDYSNKIIMDDEGNLTTSEDMSIKHTYRVSFNILNDMSYLDTSDGIRIKNYIKEEIEFIKNVETHKTFAKDRIGDNTQLANHLGVEQVDYDTVIDSYLNVFNIDTGVINKMLADTPYENMLFKLSDPKYASPMKTVQTNLVLVGLLDKK